MSLHKAHLKQIQTKLGKATLVAVSKTKPIEDIQAAFAEGVRDFGENYLQEAMIKTEALKTYSITWHYLGRLQSRKIKEIVTHFDVIHSLDRLNHAHKLNEISNVLGKKLKVFVQVNLDQESQKGGVLPKDLTHFMESLTKFHHLQIMGFMLIPKPADATETLKKFQLLKRLGTALPTQGHLSMGMSHDYELALEAGATFIRVGSAIFGERQP